MNRPLILVVNDDGISSKGIRTLIKIMNDFGDVVVVALINHNLLKDMLLLLKMQLGVIR